MRVQCFVYLLLAGLAYGQGTVTASTPAASNTPETEKNVRPDDPVITIDDFCADPAPPGEACKTVVTRAQFEKLAEALQPGMSLSLRLNVANAYARNLRMSAAAEKRGLDKTPAFAEEMRFARMQLLAQDLTRTLQEEANHITDADLEAYYRTNQKSYEEATLARIFVPRTQQPAPPEPANTASPDAQFAARASEEAMTKVAADLRARAVNGEDPDKLQIEAYTEAGIPHTAPNTKMEKVRRATLPPQHEAVMDLKPGDVSQVFSDPGGAHFIYKMIGKQTLTLENAKTEIRSTISTQRYRDTMKAFQGNVAFSDAYFNPPGTAATPPHKSRKGKRKTPATSNASHD
jgi:hypothetical protein